MVEGCTKKVNEFIESIKTIPQWRLYRSSRMSVGAGELRIDCYFDEKPERLIKPSITNRKISKLEITSVTGETMEITLLDAEVVQMGNGVTYVHGKNYDPFSVGVGGRGENDE
jgi:hypothetical protein